MRGSTSRRSRSIRWDFPSFSEGLSLRVPRSGGMSECLSYFPSFSEGLSLRAHSTRAGRVKHFTFPFLFGGTFIEGQIRRACPHEPTQISLPFGRDFH